MNHPTDARIDFSSITKNHFPNGILPTFPEFKPLHYSDKEILERYSYAFPSYSDFNFLSLHCYNVRGATKICTLHGNLIVRMLDYTTTEPIITLLGLSRMDETIETLGCNLKNEFNCATLKLVPEITVRAIKNQSNLRVTEDPDSFDYVHEVEGLIRLPGKDYAKKRYSIRSFRERNSYCEVKLLDLYHPQTQSAIRSVLQEWKSSKQRSSDEVAIEFIAIERCLQSPDLSNLVAVGAYVDEKLIGFTINEPLKSGFYMAHFGKASHAVKGLSDFLEHETAKIMGDLGCTMMNNQQDLGIPGLRLAKRAWRPCFQLKKFTIEWIESHDTQSL